MTPEELAEHKRKLAAARARRKADPAWCENEKARRRAAWKKMSAERRAIEYAARNERVNRRRRSDPEFHSRELAAVKAYRMSGKAKLRRQAREEAAERGVPVKQVLQEWRAIPAKEAA